MALALALRGQVPPLSELPPWPSSWLYLGEGAAARIELERSLAGPLERISTADSLQQHAAALRRPYIDEIGSLSLLNDSVEWWASELAAKSAYTLLFGRLCALAVARELIASGLDNSLVVCATAALLSEVESAAATVGVETLRIQHPAPPVTTPSTRAGLIERLIGRFGPRLPLPLVSRAERARPWIRPALEQSHRFRRTVLRSLGATSEPLTGPASALLLTWVDGRGVAEGAYADPHFGWLPDALRQRGYRVAFLARFLPGTAFSDLARRLIGTGERLLFPELLLDEAALQRCEASARGFAPVIPAGSNVSGVPFAQLAHEHVEEFRAAQAYNLAYEPLVEGLARAGVEPELLIYTFEGHAWEQILIHAVRTHLPRTRVIGFDNLNMTRLALSLFPAAAELDMRPLPDRIATNGPAFKDVLLREGVPERLVAVGCGIRHTHLSKGDGKAAARRPGRPMVLVATDASFDRAVELVIKAVEAFGSGNAWELVVKCHPLVATDAVEAFVREATGFTGAYVDRPIPELLSRANLMLYTYSAVCYEALAAGVPPVFVQAETDLDLDQLEPFTDLRWAGRTVVELQAAAHAIVDLEPAQRAAWRARAEAAVRATLAPLSPDCVEAFLA